FSPDGNRIVSGSLDNTLKLWDAATGQGLRTLRGHTGWVSSVAFSLDGNRIVSGSSDTTLKLWDAATGQELRTLQGHTSGVISVAFSADGARIVSGSSDNPLKLWDTAKGQELRTLRRHTTWVTKVAFSAGGARIFSQAVNGEKIVWDPQTGDQLEGEPWQDFDNLDTVTNDGRWLVTSSGDDVWLVDREYMNQPDEKAFRAFRAKPNPQRHREQAAKAESGKDWYAALFHRAWIMKADPDQAAAHDSLHYAYQQWRRTFKTPESDKPSDSSSKGGVQGDTSESTNEKSANKPVDPDIVLQPIVREMLKLPRGTKKDN
ncbi:MAG: WD40 repeat domain-containing protein, partial [Pirellulaceae bacterium]